MKKNIAYILSILVSGLAFLSCEDTLDTTARPLDEITQILVTLQNEQRVDPNDNSGLAPPFATFVDLPVTFSSTTPDNLVMERVWEIPQPQSPSTLNFEEIMEMGPVTRSFNRPNNTALGAEQFGFPIILTETLNTGEIRRTETQVQVRGQVTAVIDAPATTTVNFATPVTAADLGSLGLASTDVLVPGQIVLEWDFGNGFIETPEGRVSTVESLDVNQIFNVFFENETPEGGIGETVTLTITREFPALSTATGQTDIIVVAGLTPNRGAGRDPIKLSAAGNAIIVGYSLPIGDISGVLATDYSLAINTSEVTDAASAAGFDQINVTGVQIDPNDPNNVLLTLSGIIPSILMDDVTLTFTSENLTSTDGVPIDTFENSLVAETGRDLMGDLGKFEDTTTWGLGRFFPGTPSTSPELQFSSEQSFDGANSFLFTPMGTTPASAIGLSIDDVGAGTLPSDSPPGAYILSFWIYVESAEAGMDANFFLLDFGDFTTGAGLDNLPRGEWVQVSSVRNINEGSNIEPLIRVRNGDNSTGNGRIFVDQLSIRVVDDGR